MRGRRRNWRNQICPSSSADYIISKIEPQNKVAHDSWTLTDSNHWISEDGADVIITMRIEGEFFEDMELRDFPADVQNLTIKMIYVGANMSNKKTERLRAVFVRDDELSGTMVAAGFFMRQTWEMLGMSKKGDQTARLACKATECRAGLEFETSAGLEQDIYVPEEADSNVA